MSNTQSLNEILLHDLSLLEQSSNVYLKISDAEKIFADLKKVNVSKDKLMQNLFDGNEILQRLRQTLYTDATVASKLKEISNLEIPKEIFYLDSTDYYFNSSYKLVKVSDFVLDVKVLIGIFPSLAVAKKYLAEKNNTL